MRRASRTCPRALLSLCEPVVIEVLALEIDAPPGALGEPAGEVQRRRAAAEVAQQELELAAIAGVRARL